MSTTVQKWWSWSLQPAHSIHPSPDSIPWQSMDKHRCSRGLCFFWKEVNAGIEAISDWAPHQIVTYWVNRAARFLIVRLIFLAVPLNVDNSTGEIWTGASWSTVLEIPYKSCKLIWLSDDTLKTVCQITPFPISCRPTSSLHNNGHYPLWFFVFECLIQNPCNFFPFGLQSFHIIIRSVWFQSGDYGLHPSHCSSKLRIQSEIKVVPSKIPLQSIYYGGDSLDCVINNLLCDGNNVFVSSFLFRIRMQSETSCAHLGPSAIQFNLMETRAEIKHSSSTKNQSMVNEPKWLTYEPNLEAVLLK